MSEGEQEMMQKKRKRNKMSKVKSGKEGQRESEGKTEVESEM